MLKKTAEEFIHIPKDEQSVIHGIFQVISLLRTWVAAADVPTQRKGHVGGQATMSMTPPITHALPN